MYPGGTWKLLWVREISLCDGKICVGYAVKEYKGIGLMVNSSGL